VEVFLWVKEEELTSMDVQVGAEVGTESCYDFEIFVMLLDLETDERPLSESEI